MTEDTEYPTLALMLRWIQEQNPDHLLRPSASWQWPPEADRMEETAQDLPEKILREMCTLESYRLDDGLHTLCVLWGPRILELHDFTDELISGCYTDTFYEIV